MGSDYGMDVQKHKKCSKPSDSFTGNSTGTG